MSGRSCEATGPVRGIAPAGQRSGAVFPTGIGLGCMGFGSTLRPEAAEQLFCYALDHGIRYFDTADVYGYGRSEELLGQFVRTHRARQEVAISTKVGRHQQDQRRIRFALCQLRDTVSSICASCARMAWNGGGIDHRVDELEGPSERRYRLAGATRDAGHPIIRTL